MNQSPNKFKQEFIDAQLEVLWRQWSALGVAGNTSPEQKRVIDAEALFAYTLSIGSHDKRLLHAALEWLNQYSDWLSVSRLRTAASLLCRPDAPLNQGIISIQNLTLFKNVIEHQKPRWASVIKLLNEQEIGRAPSRPPVGFKSRGILGPVNLRQPALAQLRLRGIFGVEARADIFLFLLFNEDGNSNSIAKDIFADQGNVYKILEKWAAAGLVVKTSGHQTTAYSLADKAGWFNILGLDRKLVFLNWVRAFHALGRISIALDTLPWAADEYLLASLFRDITADLQPLAKQLKIDLPEPTGHPGAGYYKPFTRMLSRLVNDLKT